jgi:hypothetical protein
VFKGTILGVDEWEALCKDRNAYSISVLADWTRPSSHR